MKVKRKFMPGWWKEAKDVLRGKAKGSKLIVLGISMVGLGVALTVFYQASWASVFVLLGILAFWRGLLLYVAHQSNKT